MRSQDEIDDDPTAPRGPRVPGQPAPTAVSETAADAHPRTGDRHGSGDDASDDPIETSPKHGGPSQTDQPMTTAASYGAAAAPELEPLADASAPSIATDSWADHTIDDTSTTPALDDMENSL